MGDPATSAVPRRTDTDDPRRARERALKILFQADVRGATPRDTLARLTEDPAALAMLDEVDELEDGSLPLPAAPGRAAGRSAGGIDGFTTALVLGVGEHGGEIDELITRYARRWQISRMPVLDRTVLRLATYELLHQPTPPAVVIDEAVTLAKGLSTDDSGRYVNGVLESIRKDIAARRPETNGTTDG
jgi:transcription antitermination protein NusB